MIVDKNKKPVRPIEIDLSGPEGNAYVLMGYAQRLGRQLGMTQERVDAIIKVMKMSNYDGLVHTFDVEFGDYVIIYK